MAMIEQRTVWVGHPSQWINIKPYTYLVGMLLLFAIFEMAGLFNLLFTQTLPFLSSFKAFLKTIIFLVPVLRMVWLWLDVKFHIYELTEEVFREHYGILNRETHELELYRINDTMTFKPFELNILGMGNVILHTSDASDPVVQISAIKDPDHIRQMVRHYVEVQRQRKGVVEVANR